MRSSRVSRDTAKLLERSVGSASPPPRRTTRSLAAKFAYTSGATTNGSKKTSSSQTPDIEDAISPPAKKRKTEPESPAKYVKLEFKEEDDDNNVSLSGIASPPAKATKTLATTRRARKPARKTADPETGETTVSPPSDWEEMYELVRKMRAPGGVAYGAAVDTMGCERLADRSASPKDQRFHALIALMLSSQTKDTVNAVVMKRLQTELPAYKPGAPVGLNLDNVLAVEPNVLNEMIWAVGFHNNKTKYIKQAAEILRDKWNGDIPDTIQGLTSLPGVGPKMGYLCLSVAWNRTEGIGVDVHVHRITNLWGWNKTRDPEGTRLALQSWLPRDRWREINGLLVGLGQAVCLPVGRRCGECELGLRGLCKAAERKKVLEGRRMREEEEEEEEERVKTEVKMEIKTEIKTEEEESASVAAAAVSATATAATTVKVETAAVAGAFKKKGEDGEYTVKQEREDEAEDDTTTKAALNETKVSTAVPADPNSLNPSTSSKPGRRKRTRASAT